MMPYRQVDCSDHSYQAQSKEVEDKSVCLGLFVLDGSFFFKKY